jgi:hypothetical protein
MTKRQSWNLGALCLLFGIGSALGQPASLSNDSSSLRGGIPEKMPGFSVTADGQLLISDPVQKKIKTCFEDKMKRRIVWSEVPTARLLNRLVANELDFVYPMQFNSDRNAIMLPSDATWRTEILQISRKKIDMTDKAIRVGVRLNSPEHADLKEAGYSNIAATSDYEALNKMLFAELIDVAVLPNTVYQEIDRSHAQGLIITVRSSREVGFYLNKADPGKMLDSVNRAVKSCGVH